MSIVYTLIAKNNNQVLCEYSDYSGNFELISRNLLKKVQKESRATFAYGEEFFFHYVNHYGITYMCMSDSKISQDTAFAFLEEVKTLFTDIFTPQQIEKAIAESLNSQFKDHLRSRQAYYNANLNESDNIAKLKKHVIEYKDNILEADEELNKRGEKITLVLKKAEDMRTESVKYKYGAKKVKKTVSWRRWTLIGCIILIVLLLGYFLFVIICGWTGDRCFN
jgi:hypothetical protein